MLRLIQILINLIKKPNEGVFEIKLLARKTIQVFRQNGLAGLIKKARWFFRKNYAASPFYFAGVEPLIKSNTIKLWAEKNKPAITILIPSYNDFDLISDCIASLVATVPQNELNVLIVDDSANPKHAEKLATLGNKRIRIHVRSQNGGFAKCVNSGMELINSGDIILLNSDTVAHRGWFEALKYGASEFEGGAGIVGPKLLYPDGRIQSAGTYRNTAEVQWFDHLYRFKPSDHGPANIATQVLAMTGACLYVKREVIDVIGHLDEGCVFAFDDVDYCLRGWEAGFKTLYFPAAVLTHREGATRPKSDLQRQREMVSISYFWNKWGHWFDHRNVRDPKTGKIRLIYVLQSTGISGGIRTIFEQMAYLENQDFQCELWCLDAGPSWIETRTPVRSFISYDELTSALMNEDAIKIATWWETAYPVWKASLRRGIPVYYIQEVETWFYPNDKRAQQSVIASYRPEFQNITISQYNLDELTGMGVSARLITSAFDDTKFKPIQGIQRRPDILLSAGRSFFQKNFNFTLRAWQLLGESRPNLWLYGQEPQMENLDPKIKYFTRPTDEELNILYNKCTAFILTSRHEGFALPPLEAMASGTPVICTDAHGNRDYISPSENCILVEQDNDNQLRDAISKIFSSPDLRDKMSRECIKTAQRFGWSEISKQLASFYQDVSRQPSGEVVQSILKKQGIS
jgi:GT2 family glycosyltransferase